MRPLLKKHIHSINENQYLQLRKLSETLDPFKTLSEEEIAKLNELGITELTNPFEITNQMIMLMENYLEKNTPSDKIQ